MGILLNFPNGFVSQFEDSGLVLDAMLGSRSFSNHDLISSWPDPIFVRIVFPPSRYLANGWCTRNKSHVGGMVEISCRMLMYWESFNFDPRGNRKFVWMKLGSNSVPLKQQVAAESFTLLPLGWVPLNLNLSLWQHLSDIKDRLAIGYICFHKQSDGTLAIIYRVFYTYKVLPCLV